MIGLVLWRAWRFVACVPVTITPSSPPATNGVFLAFAARFMGAATFAGDALEDVFTGLDVFFVVAAKTEPVQKLTERKVE
ncbi:hypothetical protein Gbth_088_018 [Gluconobacter thailandicus F149-1 = NBRC 100600]|nr:hypothetical protein Gbth_088_018 [Gluconobacter thailandicus F149-1 = NBRC 100600]GEL88539.1 hypothetical protein GTH01_28970 [Gluconobacter thailandicus F149-1 = NBRC 100600]